MTFLVKDESNRVLATVNQTGPVTYSIERAECCSIGTYFEILSFLREEGFLIK